MKLFALIIFLSLSITAGAQTMGGIGASLIIDTAGGTTMPRIFSLVHGTPADSNLFATDYIISVDGTSCKDKTIEEVVSLIRGDTGTHVTIIVADTKEGKRPRTYTLTRRSLPGVANQPPPDPVAFFNSWCDNEAVQLKAKGHAIIKTYNATCGNRFFNFEAAAKQYHIIVFTMSDAGTSTQVDARVFDNDNEGGAATLIPEAVIPQGKMVVARSACDMTFKKACIGVVNVHTPDNAASCHAVYVIVYK